MEEGKAVSAPMAIVSSERERERVYLRENNTFSPYGPFVAP
jgi:hypothetical protein|tara:strand:- start:11 stop:133 length:123 start_codon:yes stop_codon:yes gene_type:complete